jgi:expansin (peptidoglycan-binding protein)
LKLEVQQNGQWLNLEKQDYNHFLGTNLGNQPLKIRITDIRGVVLNDTLPALAENGTGDAYIVKGNVQFPD